jgi:hypothetical protein
VTAGFFAAQEVMPFNKRDVTSFRYTGFPGRLDRLRRSEKPGLTLAVGGDYAEDTQTPCRRTPGRSGFLVIGQIT